MSDAPEPLWRVRPPWPDEMERLPAELREPLSRRGVRRHWLWVLVAGELERIVGGAILAERDPGSAAQVAGGRIDHALLPAWNASPAPVTALLDATLAQTETLGLARLEGQARIDTPAAAWFTGHGFELHRAHEVWRVPLEANFTLRHAAIERSLARHPVALRPLDETALPAVRALCAAHGLLPAHRVVIAGKAQDGLDPRLSFVAGPPAAPTAILLARLVNHQAYLEVLARAPESGSSGPEIGALLHVFFRAALALGADEALCTLHTGHAPGTVRLLTRSQARREERFALFLRTSC